MTPVDTLQLAHGMTARIYHDQDVEMPSVCDDALRIVILTAATSICLTALAAATRTKLRRGNRRMPPIGTQYLSFST